MYILNEMKCFIFFIVLVAGTWHISAFIPHFQLRRIDLNKLILSDFRLKAYRQQSRNFNDHQSNSYNDKRSSLTAGLKFKRMISINLNDTVSLESMPISEATKQALRSKGFVTMTPVQSQSYDHVFSGTDVIARSRTGTGKTFAFGIPLVERLVGGGRLDVRNGRPVVVILEPTRELALQVAQELSYIAAVHNIEVSTVYGGTPIGQQENMLRKGVHILVATPGRALDHITRGTLDLSQVQHVVLDEGDTMLEMGFQKAVESIIANVKQPGEQSRREASEAMVTKASRFSSRDEHDFNSDRNSRNDGIPTTIDGKADRNVQMLLFSATMPNWICELSSKHMNDPIFLDTVHAGETRLADTVTHYAIPISSELRGLGGLLENLISVRGEGGQTIIFTNTKQDADRLVEGGSFTKLRTQVIHGDISQAGRQRTIALFKNKEIDVLIATDVAARGLDIQGVDLVLHYGPPRFEDSYVHRSGRTGRAGRLGKSIVLYTRGVEERMLESFERRLNFHFERIKLPTAKELTASNADYLEKKIRKVRGSAVGDYMSVAEKMIQSFLQDEIVPISAIPSPVDVGVDTGAIDLSATRVPVEEKKKTTRLKSKTQLEQHEAPETAAANDSSVSKAKDVQYKEVVRGLVARCLALLSDKSVLTAKSLMTGIEDFTTFQVEVEVSTSKHLGLMNASSWVSQVQNWLSPIDQNQQHVGINALAAGSVDLAGNKMFAVFDLNAKSAEILQSSLRNSSLHIPEGVIVKECYFLPKLLDQGFMSMGITRADYLRDPAEGKQERGREYAAGGSSRSSSSFGSRNSFGGTGSGARGGGYGNRGRGGDDWGARGARSSGRDGGTGPSRAWRNEGDTYKAGFNRRPSSR